MAQVDLTSEQQSLLQVGQRTQQSPHTDHIQAEVQRELERREWAEPDGRSAQRI